MLESKTSDRAHHFSLPLFPLSVCFCQHFFPPLLSACVCKLAYTSISVCFGSKERLCTILKWCFFCCLFLFSLFFYFISVFPQTSRCGENKCFLTFPWLPSSLPRKQLSFTLFSLTLFVIVMCLPMWGKCHTIFSLELKPDIYIHCEKVTNFFVLW